MPTSLGVLVPAYFYPSPGGSPWDQLTADAQRVPIVAIMNPNSGPGSDVDTNYVAAVDGLRAAGGWVIGYVHTSYATRSLDTVLAEIDTYRGWYNLDGFFIDEMSNDGGETSLAYYQQIYDYVHWLDPAWAVVGNPGANTEEAYLARPTADVLVLFENSTGYDTYTPPEWQASYAASRFAHLVYNVSDVATTQTYVNLAVQRNTGWVYITDDTLPNPWDTLPTYWSEFVAAVAESNSADPP